MHRPVVFSDADDIQWLENSLLEVSDLNSIYQQLVRLRLASKRIKKSFRQEEIHSGIFEILNISGLLTGHCGDLQEVGSLGDQAPTAVTNSPV